MNSTSTTCENAKFRKRTGESLLGHSDSSSRLQKSECRSVEVASWPHLFCNSSGRVSNLPVFGSPIVSM
jgi:hypothetical protein